LSSANSAGGTCSATPFWMMMIDTIWRVRSRLALLKSYGIELQRPRVLEHSAHDVVGRAVWHLNPDVERHLRLSAHESREMGEELLRDGRRRETEALRIQF